MRARLRWLTAPLLVAALAAAGCLTASQESRLQTDMAQVREQVFAMQRDTAAILTRLQELERVLEVQGGSSPARFADLEALLRTLTDEVRALGARLDDNTSRMTALSRDVIAARRDEMLAAAAELAESYHRRFVGHTVEALVETRRDRGTGLLCGYTRRYVRAFFGGPDTLQGKLVDVQVAEGGPRGVRAQWACEA